MFVWQNYILYVMQLMYSWDALINWNLECRVSRNWKIENVNRQNLTMFGGGYKGTKYNIDNIFVSSLYGVQVYGNIITEHSSRHFNTICCWEGGRWCAWKASMVLLPEYSVCIPYTYDCDHNNDFIVFKQTSVTACLHVSNLLFVLFVEKEGKYISYVHRFKKKITYLS